MKEAILKDLQEVIDSISYGDITRNELESKLESTRDDINEYLIEGDE